MEGQQVKLGTRYWLLQLLPPLILIIPLFVSSDGTVFVFLIGLCIIPVLISVVSIIIKVFSFKTKKHLLLRPLTTIFIMAILLVAAVQSHKAARTESLELANSINKQCQRDNRCPEVPAGWDIKASGWIDKRVGNRLGYLVSYSGNGDSFTMMLYFGPDYSMLISGGVGQSIIVSAGEQR